MKIIEVERSIRTDLVGYISLISLYNKMASSDDPDIELSFKNTTWFEANLASVLGAIVNLIRKRGYSVQFSNLSTAIKGIFARNGFLDATDIYRTNVSTDTVISFQQFTPNQDGAFNEYISRELLSKKDFPNHSPLLGKRIGESIFEIFENARTHGKCEYIHTCGQYFPQNIPARLDMTIVDVGNTILSNVNNYFATKSLKQMFEAHEAIEWAIQKGNTTKIDRTGGLGLSVLMEFVKLNKGVVQFVSANGYWQYKNGNIFKKEISYTFPGTIVNVEFNFDDTSFYSLRNEPSISLDDIF